MKYYHCNFYKAKQTKTKLVWFLGWQNKQQLQKQTDTQLIKAKKMKIQKLHQIWGPKTLAECKHERKSREKIGIFKRKENRKTSLKQL